MSSIISQMDERSRQQSLCVYYGFGCHPDTCFTTQLIQRFWSTLSIHLINVRGNSDQRYVLASGSQCEGTSLTAGGSSDVDQMMVYTQFPVYPIGYIGDNDLTKRCFHLKSSVYTRPGYCLVDEEQFDFDAYYKCEQEELHQFVGSLFEGDRINSGILSSQAEITGPAVASIETFPGSLKSNRDYVIAFASKHWPDECRNWSDQFTWPSVVLQDSIKKEGFHIVKVGHPLSPERDKECRLSFSVAEKMLIHSFNPTQLTCAVVMKWLMNHYIKPVVPDSINSYHIKTLMLWSVEQDIDQKWEPQYFIQCLTNILKKLLNCIYDSKLQHYFIPNNNLFECKVTRMNKNKLIQKVKSIQLSVVDCCITLLSKIGINNNHLAFPPNFVKELSLQVIANHFVDYKAIINSNCLHSMCLLMKLVVTDWLRGSTAKIKSQNKLYISLADKILSVFSDNFPNPNQKVSLISDKCFSYFKTWCGSILLSLYNSNARNIRLKEHDTNVTKGDDITWGNILATGTNVLRETFENASTTGCIKMALVHMCEGDHDQAVPLLKRSLNIIAQFDNYSLLNLEPAIVNNFKEYKHLYNDQQAIESELSAELLNDRVLCKTLFIWLEMSLLPGLLQLELTSTIYKENILNLLELANPFVQPIYQYWNPIPLTQFLLFSCHYELLKSVTFLEPACLMVDIINLQYLITDRQQTRQDEVPALINILSWYYLKIGERRLMVEHSVKTVQQSTGCDKTLFSHLLIQHVIGAVITQDVRCYVPDRKVLVYDRKLF